MQKVTFAENSQLKEIGKDAFYQCNSLVLVLSEGLESIGREWFRGSGINEARIPASVQSIGQGAFQECASLMKVVFAAGSRLREVGPEAFDSSERLQIDGAPALVRKKWPRASGARGCGAV